MPQTRTEKTSILRLSTLVLGCAALFLASAAEAQVRPSNSVYLTLRGGTTVYGGELDQTGDGGANESAGATSWLTKDFGWLAGAELGYQFTRSLGFGLGFNYAAYKNLTEPRDAGNNPPLINSVLDDDIVPSVVAAFRFMPFAGAKLSPYTNLGAQLTFASDNGSGREMGYGPLVGLGLDFALSNRASLFAEANMGFIFPDAAVDGYDPGGNTGQAGSEGDETEFDNLGFYGAGLRYSFGSGATKAEIESLQCPSEAVAGSAASFMMMTKANATEPVAYSWQWGDGSTGTGMSTSHTFRTPGTYTVTAMTSNAGGQDSESCLVTVTAPVIPLALTGCRATPATANPGAEVTFNATVTGAESVSINFGDGSTASALPARHAYANAGTYRATITATGAGGATRSCDVTVTVGDTFCDTISELNPAYFGFGAATLTADARSRIDENIEILRRCPSICVTVNGYTDDRESDQTRLSQRRADAIRDYYIAQGIDASRVRAVGRGQDPNANSKEDPGPGDSRARRADSIPSSCTGF